MSSLDRSFSKGFIKVAAPAWFYELNRTLNKVPPIKGISRVGLKNTRIGKGLAR